MRRTGAFDETDYRLAATALLIHVVSLDGEPTAVEKRKLHSLIETRFKLDPGTADQLIASATRAEGDAVDLYHFTSVIMREVNEEGRLRIVEMLWEMVFADGKVTSSRTMCCGALPISRHFRARPHRAQASGRGAAAQRRSPAAPTRPTRRSEATPVSAVTLRHDENLMCPLPVGGISAISRQNAACCSAFGAWRYAARGLRRAAGLWSRLHATKAIVLQFI